MKTKTIQGVMNQAACDKQLAIISQQLKKIQLEAKAASRTTNAKKNNKTIGKKRGSALSTAYLAPGFNLWVKSLIDPFTPVDAHIPDTQTTQSAILRGTNSAVYTFPASATAGTSHSFGLILTPYVNLVALVETDSGNGILHDLQTGAYINQIQPQNLAGFGTNVKLRVVSAAVRLLYEGTELNRSARVVAGLIPSTFAPISTNTTPNTISTLSTITGALTSTISNLRESMVKWEETRFPGSGVIEAVWSPNGVPSYQGYSQTTASNLPTTSTSTPIIESFFYASPGQNGCQIGQNNLVILVEGDTTAASQLACNNYDVEVCWNYEVIPVPAEGVAYSLSPSPSNASQVDSALNFAQSMPILRDRMRQSKGGVVQQGLPFQ